MEVLHMANRSPLKQKPLRNPGQSLDAEIDRVINDKFVGYFWFAAVFWVFASMELVLKTLKYPRLPGMYAFTAIFFTVIAVYQFFRVRQRVRNLQLGRDGERAVGQYLERLRAEGAQVFHDVLADRFNLDHVVIVDKGIFVIETKTWSKRDSKSTLKVLEGEIFKNGFRVDPNPIQQVAASAKWLAQLITESTGKTLPTFGVVVFPGWFVEPADDKSKKIAWVLEPKALPAFIANEPTRLAESDVKLAAFHLGRYMRSMPATSI